MNRPKTAQDVIEALHQHRLVESRRLDAFLSRHRPVDVMTILEHLVMDGLLTAFQATTIADGQISRLVLGNYHVLDRLGTGGMASVYLGVHSILGRRVALKTLSDSLRADPGARKWFVREARAAASLDHPNIVRVFDVNMIHEPPFLVMEFVDGISFQAAVAETGSFTVGEAAAVGMQVADGLIHAASVGLVHRDIKPANLLIDRRGSVKILDLGIVRFTHDETNTRVNAAECILGTLDYLAPEQAENSSNVDTRADLYSLGATMYFLLVGRAPYDGMEMRQKLAAKQSVDPIPIHQFRPDVPPEFSTIVERLMARDPAQRYSSPAKVVAALFPWVAVEVDFPARLFRGTSQTTHHNRRSKDRASTRESLPDTVLILKLNRRDEAITEHPGDDKPTGSPITMDEGRIQLTPHPAEPPPTDPGRELPSSPESETLHSCTSAAKTGEFLAPLLPPPPNAQTPDDIFHFAADNNVSRPLSKPSRSWRSLAARLAIAFCITCGSGFLGWYLHYYIASLASTR